MSERDKLYDEIMEFCVNIAKTPHVLLNGMVDELNILGEIRIDSSAKLIFNKSKLVTSYIPTLHKAIRGELSVDNIKIIILVFAIAYYENLISSGLVDETGTKVINRFMGLNAVAANDDWGMHTVLQNVPMQLMKLEADEHVSNINESANVMNSYSDKIAKARSDIDDMLSSANKSITEYIDKAENIKSKLNFVILNNAFSEYIKVKNKEILKYIVMLIAMGALLIAVPIIVVLHNNVDALNLPLLTNSSSVPFSNTSTAVKAAVQVTVNKDIRNEKYNTNVDWPYVVNKLIGYMPLAVIELLILFYFRIMLHNYNSAKAQLLQLKMRESVCQFIEDYIKFKKTCNVDELDKFETLIFSNLMPNAEQIPSTLEGLEHLGKILGEFKPKKD